MIDIPTYHSTKHIHIHHQKHKINACSYECIPYLTYLTASHHLCINAWTFECMFMAKKEKEKEKETEKEKKSLKRNPNLACLRQISNQIGK